LVWRHRPVAAHHGSREAAFVKRRTRRTSTRLLCPEGCGDRRWCRPSTVRGVRNPFTRDNLAYQVREASKVGWFNLVLVFIILVPAMIAVALIWRGVEVWWSQGVHGVAGTVRITNCAQRGRTSSGWTCEGEFTSGDGRVRIPRIQVFPYFPRRPNGSVPARVVGPDAGVATRPGGWAFLVPLGGGLAFTYFAAYLAYSFYLEPPTRPPGRRRERTAD
jgi:hypothetical protein